MKNATLSTKEGAGAIGTGELPGLMPHHLADLRRSGLNNATITESGIRSATSAAEVGRCLNLKSPAVDIVPALEIPFRNIDGTLNGFRRYKPDKPREGKGKYEQPAGAGNRAYFTLAACEAIKPARVTIAIAEGEKKAIAIAQSGIPCIGITGVDDWHVKHATDTEGKRTGDWELIPDLAAIDWKDRIVLLLPDTDPRRNPSDNKAFAELARILTAHGAIVHIIRLPVDPRDTNGMPEKNAPDDFITRHGEQAFREFVESAMQPPAAASLDDYRKALAAARFASVGHPGVNLDRSPAGAGKSTADVPAIAVAETSLTVVPTHRNATEVQNLYIHNGHDAAAYPKLSPETCGNFDEAAKAIAAGLSPSNAVCPTCRLRRSCDYQKAMQEAESADHRIATHQRARLSFGELAAGRNYIAIHEDVTGLLRPVAEISSGFAEVAKVANHAKGRAAAANDVDHRCFFDRMEESAIAISECLEGLDSTTSLAPPPACLAPNGIDARLFAVMRSTQTYPPAEATQICRGVAAGEIDGINVRTDRILQPSKETVVKRSVIAVWRTQLPPGVPVWLSDATAERDEIEGLVGHPVIDRTPAGQLERRHAAVQVPHLDVKQSTGRRKLMGILRGVLAAYPQYTRVGIICHKQHVPAIRGTAKHGPVLHEDLRSRISKVEHYRSGEGRGSNAWLDECDVILVVGTPRVPPSAIKNRLIQIGRVAAAGRDATWKDGDEWGTDYWSGITTEGKRMTVPYLAYRDHDWYSAHRSIVRAELIQAIGRGRGICPNGVPVIVLSNEPLDLPILDANNVQPVSASAVSILQAILRLSEPTSKGECQTGASEPNPNIYLGNGSVSSASIAIVIGKSDRYVRKALDAFAGRGLVERVGQRKGWKLTPTGLALLQPSSPPIGPNLNAPAPHPA